MYHGAYNSLRSQPPAFTKRDLSKLKSRCPAELLLFGYSAASFPAALTICPPSGPP